MAFSVHSFGNNLFRALYSDSLLAVLGLNPNEASNGKTANAFVETVSLLTQELLDGFSFSLNDVSRVFNLADGFQTFTGEGNQQLTQQEIRFYLDHIQQAPAGNLPDRNAVLILLLLDHYFEQLADIHFTTPLGAYRAISLGQLENLAGEDGNLADFTVNDIARYLERKVERAQAVTHANLQAEMPAMIQHAGERQLPSSMKNQPFQTPRKYSPWVEMAQAPKKPEINPKMDLEEADDLALRLQVFSFSVEDILLLTHAQKGPIRLDEVEKNLKVVEAYLLELERLMQALIPGGGSDNRTFPKAMLGKKLEEARRSAQILRVLRRHFHEIAQIDGDDASISQDDIRMLASMDGNIDDFTPDDFRMLRKQRQ